MAFWNTPPTANDTPESASAMQAKLNASQAALGQSRRRLLGAALLLAMACALIPWIMDSTPRAWGDDVLLRMPKVEKPYQKDPKANSGLPVLSASPPNIQPNLAAPALPANGAASALPDTLSTPSQAAPAFVLPPLAPLAAPPLAPQTPTAPSAPNAVATPSVAKPPALPANNANPR